MLIVVMLAIAAAGLTACGSSGTSTGSSGAGKPASGESTEAKTETTTPIASGPPLAVAYAIPADQHPGLVATEYTEDGAILVSMAIERGGGYRMSVYRGPGAELTLGAFPLSPKVSIEKRYHVASHEYGKFTATVDGILGQMPPTRKVSKQLASLPPGYAVGQGLREAVQAVRGKQGERWAVVAGSGIDDTQGKLPVQNVQQTARILRKAVGDVDARGVGIAMVGVGIDPQHSKWSVDGPLTQAWAIVCHEIHARACQIHADPRLPPPLEGTAHAILEGV
jgi:hypothetical protein